MFKKSILLNFRNFILEFWSVGNTVCFGSIDKEWSSFGSIWKLSNHMINYNKTDEFNWTGCYGTITSSGVYFISSHEWRIQNASSELFLHFSFTFFDRNIVAPSRVRPKKPPEGLCKYIIRMFSLSCHSATTQNSNITPRVYITEETAKIKKSGM